MCRIGYRSSRVPEHRESSSSSHELPLEPRAKVEPSKHNIFTHFPKDWNCDICSRTKIRRASCRRRTGTVVPRAEYFSDLITADHKVLGEGCESRHNHRYAVVVQDLATQWIQSCPCKTKTCQETQKSLQKFLEPTRKRNVIYTDNSLESFEDLSWNQCTSTPHRSETNGIAERAVRILKEGTLQYCCNQVWMKNGGRITWNVTAICETFKAMVEYHPISAKDISRLHQFGPNVLPSTFLEYVLSAGEIWEGDTMVADIEELEEMDASEIYAKRLHAKEVLTPISGENSYPQSKFLEKIRI